MQIFELTYYNHVALFVDSHPNLHAKHNKLVCHVGYTVLRYEKEE